MTHLFNQVKLAFPLGKKCIISTPNEPYTKNSTITIQKERKSFHLTVISKSSRKHRSKQLESSFAFLDSRNSEEFCQNDPEIFFIDS